MRPRHPAALIACVALMTLSSVVLRAHDPGLSAFTLSITPGGLTGHFTISPQDLAPGITLDRDGDGTISEEELGAAESAIAAFVTRGFDAQIDGRKVMLRVDHVQIDQTGGLALDLRADRPSGTTLSLRTMAFRELPPGHRQLVTLSDQAGAVLERRILDERSNAVSLDLSRLRSATKADVAGQFIRLGITHILGGYDHILFLIALLLVSERLLDALKLITAFTVAHSITLALAALDVVTLSPRIVEPLIAASIVYVGIENLRRPNVRVRWMITFGFGLIHGFGFSSALREVGLGATDIGIALPLFAFNLGVEIGQAAIAIVVLLVLSRLRAWPAFTQRWVPACSLLVALAGSYWLYQRLI